MSIIIIFGVISSKIFEHDTLESGFIQVLTVCLLLALIALAWLAGWAYSSSKKENKSE